MRMRSQFVGPRVAGLACLVLMGVVGAAVVGAQTPSLRLASTEWPPFTNQPGQARYALDLVEAALGRIGQPFATTIVEDGQVTPALLRGDFDGSPAIWKDAERERTLLFSEPYLENRLVLVGRKGADVSATTLSALAGRRIALVEGYAYGEEVEKSGPVFVRTKSAEDTLSQLLAGKVDFALMDDLVVQYIADNHAREAQAKLQLGTTPLVRRPLHLAINRSFPDAQGIITRFNAQLKGMIADRTYHRLLHVDWISADVDGDGLFEYVPGSDASRVTEPTRAYSIYGEPERAVVGTPAPAESTKPRFYVGGNIYRDWASVPERFKSSSAGMPPPPSRATASLFRFSW
jgi:polar amino acid transport system substrate-binding protein